MLEEEDAVPFATNRVYEGVGLSYLQKVSLNYRSV